MANLPSITSIHKLVRISAKPGRSAELREALKSLETATNAEVGCREFALYQALSSDDSFILLEQFVDEAAFKLHMQLPHTLAFFKTKLLANAQAIDLPNPNVAVNKDS